MKAIPLALMDQKWRDQVLVREIPRHLECFSLLVFDDRLGEPPIDLRLPEGIGTMMSPAGSFSYLLGQDWKACRDGKSWRYDNASRQAYSSLAEPSYFHGEVSCTATVSEGSVEAVLHLRNGSFSTWVSPYLWICAMYWHVPAFDPNTLVQIGGEWRGYHELSHQWHGPAGMRILTARGFTEIERLEETGHRVECSIPRDLIADPARAIRAKVDGNEFTSVIESEDALILGGYDTNPCTDMALGFGDLEPGQVGTAKVTVRLTHGRVGPDNE